MKPLKLYFVLIQLIFFISYGQIARGQGSPDDECPIGYNCVKRSMCGPNALKQIIGSPKRCGKTDGIKAQSRLRSICCPLSTSQNMNAREPEFQEACGIKGEDLPLDDMNATNTKWPWLVSLSSERRGVEQFLCSGFLIDKLHVITAAHCVLENPRSRNILVRVGGIDFRHGELYNLTSISIPPGYKPTMYYDDIALLTLSREVNSPNFNPVCLPTKKSVGALEGHKGTVIGYPRGGLDQNNYRDLVELQEDDEIGIISSVECETHFSLLFSISFARQFPKGINHQMLCTEPYKRAKCLVYTSGSPLIFEKKGRWFAVGVTSFGSSGCKDAPTGYTRVSEYVEWIKENLN